MNLKKLILTNNDCYKAGKPLAVKGIMVHSTGANNPTLKRYVGPDDGLLGKNQYNNHWNTGKPDGRQVCVHAFIGLLGDGKTIATYQTLPWDMRGWHGGGAVNDTHIGFEICEDGLTDAAYFGKVYQEAVELCAYLCMQFNLNPAADGVIIGHFEGYKRGIASNHADPGHWLPKHGKSMDSFRAAVTAEMAKTGGTSPATPPAPHTPAPSTGDDASMWAFFKGKGLNDYAIAGLMGNLYAESGLKATNLQNSYEKTLNMTDDSYTKAVDNGTYTNFVRDCAGYGLAQWTYWSRKQALLDFAKAAKRSIGDFKIQMDFLWKELQTYTAVMNVLKTAKTVAEASNIVLMQYEKPADQSAAVQKKRADYGQGYFNKFAPKPAAPSTPSGLLYRVQCGAFAVKTNADALEKKLKALGHETIVKQDGSLYRVQCGAFAKRENAYALATKLKAQGFETYITTFAG